jgi:quercetin dioxygenase-like cupin family protein
MSTRSKNFLIDSEQPSEDVGNGLFRQLMGYDEQLMLLKIKFQKGGIGYVHQHIHAQTSVVVSGVFEVTINGEKKTLHAGDGFYVEPNAPHGAVCLEEGMLIDAFSPMREDFL